MQRFIYDRLRTLRKKTTDITGEAKKEYLQYSSLYSLGYIEAYGSWFLKKVCGGVRGCTRILNIKKRL